MNFLCDARLHLTIFLLFSMVFNVSAQQGNLPTFAAACSYSNGAAHYRIAVDPSQKKIYFASIVNENNLNDAKISGPVSVSPDELRFKLYEIDGTSRDAVFLRRDGDLIIFNKEEHVKYAGAQQKYRCEKLDQEEYINALSLLKRGRATGESQLKAKTDAYQNQPRKF